MSKTVPNATSSPIGTPTPMTPVRAITSTISARSAPSVPPAAQAYEPLLKSLFQQRLEPVFLFISSLTAAANGIWAYWQLGCPKLWTVFSLPFSPWIVFFALSWITVPLPMIVLRKTFLRGQRSSATSPLDIIKMSSSQNSTKIASSVYLISALSYLLIHIVMAYYYEPETRGDPKLSVFVKSKKHPYYLNGRFVFLLFSQLSTALAFSLRGAITDRFAYRWQISPFPAGAIWIMVNTSYVVSAVFATMAVFTASVVFASARIFLPILFRIPLVSLLLRPFTGHFLKGQWTIILPLTHIPLLLRAWCLAFSTFCTWEIADGLFEHVVSKTRHSLSTLTADPNTTLVSGITSDDKIFKYFAYSELRDLAKDESASAASRRTALFGDQQSSLNLWSVLLRESLALLENDYQVFLRRGQPAPPAPPPAPVTPKVTMTPSFATPTPLIRQRIFQNSPESPGQAALDALASDGPIAKVVDVGADATHVPELFRSLETQVTSSPIAAEAKKNVESAAGMGNRLKSYAASLTNSAWNKYAPEALKDSLTTVVTWGTRQRLSKQVEASLPFRELDIVVIEALSYLVSASLSEDKYGIVQRDIPKVIETMVLFLSAIEEYQINIGALQKPLPPPPVPEKEREENRILGIEVERSQEVLGLVGDGLKEGLARIVWTFGDKLLAFKFSPKVAHKLQEFFDYST